jgi:predicted pyridoxine 5'-phosphate oxidase superfamily flavin-nucleotide-binding protein
MDAQTEIRVPYASDVAFSPSVKAIQTRKGSRASYHKQEERGWRTEITQDLAGFIAAQTSFMFATASADGQPYIQHRGGPAGFLHVVDSKTLAFADFAGNRQYITQGNLVENAKAYIFIIDYLNRRRIKLWGTARVVENDPELLAKLMPEGYQARGEQVILFQVAVWDTNCPQHIPQKIDLSDVVQVMAERDMRIAELEAEVARLKAPSSASSPG